MGQDIYVHHKYEFPAHKGSENLTFQLRKQLQLVLDCGCRQPVSTRRFTSHFVNIGKFYLESKIFEFRRLKLGFVSLRCWEEIMKSKLAPIYSVKDSLIKEWCKNALNIFILLTQTRPRVSKLKVYLPA